MSSLETISERCLAVCQVPTELTRDIVCSHVQRHFKYGRILDLDQVCGIESRPFTRIVLLCSSAEDVDHMCKDVSEEEICIENRSVLLKYQKAIVCELPDRWKNFEIPEPDNNQTPTLVGSKQRHQQADTGPELPRSRPEQQEPAGIYQQQIPQYAWPPGVHGAMSGFYQNIPSHMHGGGDQNMNRGGMHHQMPAYGHAQGQDNKGYGRSPTGFSGHDHGNSLGSQQTGQNQNFPFGQMGLRFPYRGLGQFPPDNFPVWGMPRMPPNVDSDQQDILGQNVPFQPMYICAKTGQMLPVHGQGFLGMAHQQVEAVSEPHRQQPPRPSPPYNDKEFKEDKRPHETVHEEPAYKRPEEPEMQGAGEKSTKIVVSNLPATAHDEYLEMFFENKKKYGGGTVLNVDIDEDNATAVVEFEELEAVNIVLGKCPLIMMGQEVEVSIYKPEPPVPLCTIEVTGPCSVVCQEQLETLEMYFESEKRSGGDDIVDCKFDSGMKMALISFEREEVAKRVEERGNHVVNKETLTVKLHTPNNKSKRSDKPEETVEDKPETSGTIKVKGVDKSVSRDTVELYFENTKRSGGGDIDNVQSDEEEEDVLYITFKDKHGKSILCLVLENPQFFFFFYKLNNQ
ncbi:uncharacterized protein LOC123547554 [Mercenaria mercenaria]|uniref:uncharacterized protein LOC123547554 n=1 Tax=Mercenaria mercenaria TaxID=6596 RepID=UPI00234E8670|nr:uncharacterized protein LOC123547554 [Mercenaria mercenaria]